MSREHRARKRFGQNFLSDEHIIAEIGRAIAAGPTEHLVEIGPGKGALTEVLLASGCELDVIELDRDLIPLLKISFATSKRLSIHNADALRFDYTELAKDGRPLRVVGNLPYNISTPLIFHLLDHADLIQDMHFMLQLEVVNRLAAAPGSKTWGRLGAMAQYLCQVDKLFEVPPEAFDPAPKVQSAIVRLAPRPAAQIDPGERKRLDRILVAAFSQRRKTLRNTLRDLVSVQQLESLDIDPGARAETLSLDQFVALSQFADQQDQGN